MLFDMATLAGAIIPVKGICPGYDTTSSNHFPVAPG
jgi:hypothetical protein